ncbi:hypothetical protein SLNSH_00135 [Alsobacter soli]|uniref:Uncharacterized protein n=1 Tax=Alsobacter soli TaxID=2109933 RepID=A0A2T1HYR5_9HYPH|nr:hypothetical protein [Alsobacter soli]PSC06836.1 hypothetical protein SLNSH_00135 [Alsobacter soli]
MLVYGDVVRRVEPAAEWAAVGRSWARALRSQPGLARHSALVQAFIAAAELAQGVADAEAEASGFDQPGPATAVIMDRLRAMADQVLASWRSGFGLLSAAEEAWPALPSESVPPEIACKRGEGYAYYALYPEAYGIAAEPLSGEIEPRVIGLRSIGTGLAAMAAAGAGAPTPLTLRPQGHPFGRVVAPGPACRERLPVDADATYAIVDEGPGLSGSSFAGAARWLEEQGVPRARIRILPSHPGEPGPQAPEERRAWWREAPKHLVTFEDLALRAPREEHRLCRWVEDVVGPLETPMEDISGGRWREALPPGEWPAVNAWQERLKYRFRARGQTWMAKFSGLDALGAAALPRARALSEAGFSPEPAGWAHGFLVERWHGGARPLSLDETRNRAFQDRVAAYLGFRAASFPAERPGASLHELARMLEANAVEAFGPEARSAVESYRRGAMESSHRGALALERHVRPVVTDNRLHAHEWIMPQAGVALKTDALDHAFAHDLVGCQDIAWDVAGAVVEFDLDPDAAERLRRAVERHSGREVSPDLVRYLLPCYGAFQLGWWSMAADSHGGWPEEQQRLGPRVERYRTALGRLLQL